MSFSNLSNDPCRLYTKKKLEVASKSAITHHHTSLPVSYFQSESGKSPSQSSPGNFMGVVGQIKLGSQKPALGTGILLPS